MSVPTLTNNFQLLSFLLGLAAGIMVGSGVIFYIYIQENKNWFVVREWYHAQKAVEHYNKLYEEGKMP